MTSTERSDHYAFINKRWDERSKKLLDLGFTYSRIPEWDTAVFSRSRLGKKIPVTVPTALVLYADDVVWQDRLEDVSRP